MLTMQLILLFICAISRVFGEEENERVQLNVKLEKYENCEEFPDGRMSYSDIQLRNINRTFIVMNAKLSLKKRISEKFHGAIDMTRCDSKQQTGSCQLVMIHKIVGMCENMDNKNASWYGFLNSIQEFKKSCPMEEGTYDVKDAPVDVSELEKTAMWVGYWMMKARFYDGEDMVLCLDMEFSVTRKRRS